MTADYRDTVLMPRTAFPMKAKLPEREPAMVARWEEIGLYRRLREASAGRSKFVLHDGPPYANGHLHLGTACREFRLSLRLAYALRFGTGATCRRYERTGPWLAMKRSASMSVTRLTASAASLSHTVRQNPSSRNLHSMSSSALGIATPPQDHQSIVVVRQAGKIADPQILGALPGPLPVRDGPEVDSDAAQR